METSNFTANCMKFTQFANHHGKSREIRAILTKFYHFLLFKRTPPFLQQISQNSPDSQILRANHAKLTNFALISINLLFCFQTLVRQDPTPCLRESRKSCNLELEFAKCSLLYSLHNTLTFVTLLQGNSLQLEATVHQCVITLGRGNLFLYYKNANFPNFRPTFKTQAGRISET